MKYPEAHEFETTFACVCMQELQNRPDRVLLQYRIGDDPEWWTVSDLMSRALSYANQLIAARTTPDDVVAVMLDNHPDHVAVMVALSLTGAIWLPLDRRFVSANVRRLLSQVDVSVAIVEPGYADTVTRGGFKGRLISRLETSCGSAEVSTNSSSSNTILQQNLEAIISTSVRTPDDVRALLFTSGTTGPPKGVVVTERMYMASARFCGHASDAKKQAVFYLWEPLNHIGGAQIIPMAFMSGCRIAMSEKFSVSKFWPEVIASGANRMHYLGGVLELLLRRDTSQHDQLHNITLGFGAGASEQISREFTARFGIPLREVYGMTEASSFTTMNFDGSLKSIGKTLPDFDLRLTDNNGQEVAKGEVGEIVVRPKRCALVTPHYYKNEVATSEAFRDGYFRTGDLAFHDEQSYLYFVGRQKEIIRCKGENISPWEIESVFKQHSAVLEVAVVGVESDTTEQDIAAFIRLTPMSAKQQIVVVKEVTQLLNQELAQFQRPRYIVELSEFPKTPSERIEKHKLDVSAEVLKSSWNTG